MIHYEEDWIVPLLFRSQGSLAFRALPFAVLSTTITVLLGYVEEWQPGFLEDLGLPDASGSQTWNASTAVLLIVLAFRTRTAFRRFWEGTSLLHQMRGEWFDTVSNCVTFSISSRKIKPVEVDRFRHTLVRLMSLCHGSALEEIAGNQLEMDSIDIAGLDVATLQHLRKCEQDYGFNKVEVMLHLVQSLITTGLDNGILKIAPPILSRVYQTISRGFVNLLNAKKITDTRFPFPYAQTITGLLFLNTLLTPVMISQAIRSKVLAAVFTFIPIFGLYATNFIASELENPFGTDANDLPLKHFQEEMNSCLLMLLHPNTDMVASIKPSCEGDFTKLMKAFKHDEEQKAPPARLSQFQASTDGESAKSSTEGEQASSAEQPPTQAAAPAAPAVIPAPASPPALELAPLNLVSPLTPARPLSTAMLPLTPAMPSSPAMPSVEVAAAAKPLVAMPSELPMSPEAMAQLKQEEALRLDELQLEVERRMNEFYLALQRWTLMVESQVKQVHETLELLQVLSAANGQSG